MNVVCGDTHTFCIDGLGSVWKIGGSRKEIQPSKLDIPIPITKVATGEYEILFLDINSEIWYSTISHRGMSSPSKIIWPADKVLSIFCNYGRSFFITVNGSLWAKGKGLSGELGIENVKILENPTKVPLDNVVQIALGSQHTVALTSEGTVFSCGAGSGGILGFRPPSSFVDRFTQISTLKSKNIISIGCGLAHTIFLEDNGKAYGCGLNIDSQLGLLDEIIDTPTIIPISNPIGSIACKNKSTLCLDTDGSIWVFGSDGFGEIGSSTLEDIVQFPCKLNNIETPVQMIVPDFTHTIVRDVNGRYWGFGFNENGQLGIDPIFETIVEPKILNVFSEIIGPIGRNIKSARK